MDQNPTEASDLKSLLLENVKLAQENNRMLRSMRRHAWLNSVGHVLTWAVIIVGSYYFYTIYLAPYIHLLPSSAELQNLLNSYRASQ